MYRKRCKGECTESELKRRTGDTRRRHTYRGEKATTGRELKAKPGREKSVVQKHASKKKYETPLETKNPKTGHKGNQSRKTASRVKKKRRSTKVPGETAQEGGCMLIGGISLRERKGMKEEGV